MFKTRCGIPNAYILDIILIIIIIIILYQECKRLGSHGEF